MRCWPWGWVGTRAGRLSELAKLVAGLIIQRAVEDEFDAWLGRAGYERRPRRRRGRATGMTRAPAADRGERARSRDPAGAKAAEPVRHQAVRARHQAVAQRAAQGDVVGARFVWTSELGVRFRDASESLTLSMETLPAQEQRRFRLREGERVPNGVRRIACGQLDVSIERLAGDTDEDLGTSVHETRKSLKRLRATVRLARGELGEETYRRENVALRDAGGRLGGVRDSQVLLETLDALTGRQPDEAPPARVQRFRRTLVGQHGAAQRRLHESAAVAEVLSELRRARTRVADWHLEREGLDALAPGFKRIYRRGRRAYRTARREPSTENLHELRKRAKYLWYAAQIVTPAAPKKMKRFARRAHELSNLIGEDHDLALLAERAAERRDRLPDETTADELAKLVERRRAELQGQAMDLAKRLFRKKPRKVVRPLETSGLPS
jgi:CHAD domain-containing protein